jgi:hypothetical protein
VVRAALKRLVWPISAMVALIFIAMLAVTGGRPSPGLVAFKPAGLLREVAPEQIHEVEVRVGARRWHFVKKMETWVLHSEKPAGDFQEKLLVALTLLRNSAPESILTTSDADNAGRTQFGLDPPALTVVVRSTSGGLFSISFGGPNPLGLSRYAQLKDRAEIMLMPAFVAEAWEQVVGL